MTSRTEWFTDPRRACAPGKPGNHLFTSDDKRDLRKAAKLCKQRQCPVLAECDAWATENEEQAHVWGGRVRSTKRAGRALLKASEETSLDELIEKSRAGNGYYFRKLTDEQKVAVVRGALARGYTWSTLARQLKHKIVVLQELLGEPSIELKVQQRYGWGQSDAHIAMALGVTANVVAAERRKLGLPTLYGPGGRRLEQVSA